MKKLLCYDLLVIGGGSGGLATARRAAKMYGAKVALFETAGKLGGTCVNVGCVPKKVMYNASFMAESIRHFAQDYGFDGCDGAKHSWKYLKDARDAYVARLNGIYDKNVQSDGVEKIYGHARFISKNQLVVDGDESGVVYEAPKIVIATGSRADSLNIPGGAEFSVDSDGFFQLEKLPEKVAIIGAGYIAVELAGVLNGLGSEVHLFIRYDRPLRTFDSSLSQCLLESLRSSGIKVHVHSSTKRLCNIEGLIQLTTDINGKEELFDGFNAVIHAIGRSPNVEKLDLNVANVKVEAKSNLIVTDAYQNTSQPGVYAIGDVCGPLYLTPVAIAAGRKLVDRLFGGQTDARLDYANVPTVVFSHPPIGTVGLTEAEAREKFGDASVRIYTSKFNNMYYALSPADRKQPTLFKIICVGMDERIVGIHLFGMGSDEILQGFGVALKMGAKKSDLDSCVAIHPTAAEELVTMR